MRIIIDPGHGGKDKGGGSNPLFLEKEWVLQLSLYMFDLFNKAWHVPATITRRNDVYIPPAERARIVRESGAEICLCNHVNAFDGRKSGFELYHSIHAKPLFAECIQHQLRQTDMRPNKNPIRAVESTKQLGRDYYFMHRDTGAVETLIVEYGYGDHPLDRQKLQDGWKRYAEAVVRGALVYLDRKETK